MVFNVLSDLAALPKRSVGGDWVIMNEDSLIAEELDAKASKLWEQGAREVLGDVEFERLYPELSLAAREARVGGD